MAPPLPVTPVKRLVALLWADAACRDEALDELSRSFGPYDFQGGDHPFDQTDYYVAEMGAGQWRRLVSFAPLMAPESLADDKLLCNALEDRLAVDGQRRVNLDLGYLDLSKVVLASLKYAGQKIALGRGVYADLVARYAQGRYRPFEWTFPDFRDGRYDGELAEIRARLRQQLRARSHEIPG